MSLPTDRVPVPANGKGPHPAARPSEPPPETQPVPEPASFAFTPTQLAVGFGILASLILLLVGRLRRRRSGPGRLFGRR